MSLFDDYDPTAYGAKCGECPFNGQPLVPPRSVASTKLVVLGEGPGGDEVLRKEAMAGRAGAFIKTICEEHNIPLEHTHKTNAFLCKAPATAKPEQYRQAVACCRPRLHAELTDLATDGNVAVTVLGKWALEAVSGKLKILDSIGAPATGAKFNAKGKKTEAKKCELDFSFVTYLPTIYPGFIAREPAYSPVLETHFVWGWELAQGTLPRWRWPDTAYDDADHRKSMLRRMLKSPDYVACDVETAGLSEFEDLLDIGFADSKGMVSIPWYKLDAKDDAEEIALIRALLSGKKRIVYQNGQFDINVLSRNGFALKGLLAGYWFDTLVAHQMVAPLLPHKLDFIACVEFALQRWKQEFRASSEQGSNRYIAADPVERAIYNARDCYVTYRLVERLLARIATVHNGKELFKIGMAKMRVATEMRYDGFAVYPSAFNEHRVMLRGKKTDAEKALGRLTRPLGITAYKPGNSRQTRKLFHETLGVPSSQHSKVTGEPSYNAKALLEIASSSSTSTASHIARYVLMWRRWSKLLDSYIESMPVHYYGTSKEVGFIHANWRPFGTVTGRWSCQDPSLQVIPKPKIDKSGKVTAPGLRNIFGVRTKRNWLLELDYSQLEARILALLAPDKTLLQWYADGVDVHKLTASSLFKKKPEDINDKERDLAKRARYGIAYMGTAKTIWRSLVVDYPSLTLTDVERLMLAFFKLHPDILRWQQRVVMEARTKHYVEAPLSGRRYTFMGGQIEPTKCIVAIQMTAADLMDESVLQVKRCLKQGEVLLAQVHDSLVLEGPDWEGLAKRVKAIMEREIKLGGVVTRFPIDLKVGKDWGNAEKRKV